MRYFFFSYVATKGLSTTHGNIWGKWEKMPGNCKIKEIAERRNPGMTAVITGWHEFGSEEDWDSFTGID